MNIYYFLFFLCLGSFSSASIYRYVHHQDLLFDRSRCPHCQHVLSFWQLIPLVSFCLLRGKCHYCHKPISLFYPLNELVFAFVCGIYMILYKDPLTVVLHGLYFMILYILSWVDALTMEVPLPLLLALSIVICMMKPLSVQTILFSLFVFFSLSLFYYGFQNKIGFGDILFLAIQSLLFPPFFFCLSLFIGSLVALFYLLFKKRNRLQQPLPFLPFLSLGFILCQFLSFVLQ